jgi:hypothetical protein
MRALWPIPLGKKKMEWLSSDMTQLPGSALMKGGGRPHKRALLRTTQNIQRKREKGRGNTANMLLKSNTMALEDWEVSVFKLFYSSPLHNLYGYSQLNNNFTPFFSFFLVLM